MDALKSQILDRVQSDYTEESWKSLQDLISRAEGITTAKEYDEIKGELSIDKLVPLNFEKTELINVLMELAGKRQEDYTEESWNKLQEVISIANEAKLKSEYDAVRDRLNTETLIEIEKNENFFTQIIDKLKGNDLATMIFVGCIILLIVIIILLLVLYRKAQNKTEVGAKRAK